MELYILVLELEEELRRASNCLFGPSQAAAGKRTKCGEGARCAAPLAMCECEFCSHTDQSMGPNRLLERPIDRFQCSLCVSDRIRYTLIELPNYLSAQWKLTFLLVFCFNNGGAAACAKIMLQ